MMLRPMLLLVFATLFAGCGGSTPAPPPEKLSNTNFDAVKNGMTLVQVEQMLGNWSAHEPNAVVKINGADQHVVQYQWRRPGKEIIVNFIGDKVVSKSQQGVQQ